MAQANEIEAVIKSLPAKKSTRTDEFTVEFLLTFKELTPMHFKLLHKTERETMLSNSFYEATITLIPKPDKDMPKRKLQANFLDENRCKNSKNICKLNLTTHCKDSTP
jgi:hypothetical protein